MPSSFAHIAAGLGFGTPALPRSIPRRYWIAAGLCASIPDVDWLWSFRGRPYDHWLEHRGVTHSLLFAACLAAVMTWTVIRPVAAEGTLTRLWAGLALATASHGIFDALSTYGTGVGFLIPFSTHRFFFSWRPITGGTVRTHGLPIKVLAALGQELLFVWLPSAIVAVLVWWWRKKLSRPSADA